MIYKLGTNTKTNLYSIMQSNKKSSELLVEAVEGFIKVSPIDFGIIKNGGYRTAEEQKQLYKIGVSKCDGIKNKSEHQKGLAVDLVPWVNGKYTWDKIHAYYLAGAFMAYCKEHNYDITSGADWDGDGNLKQSFNDPCHMQIKEN